MKHIATAKDIPNQFTVAPFGDIAYAVPVDPQQRSVWDTFHTNHPVGMGTEIQYDRGVLRAIPQFPGPYYYYD